MNNNDQIKPATRTVQGYLVPTGGHVPRRVQGIQYLAKWKNDPEQLHSWLCKIIGGAFQSFLISALPGQPAAEMLPHTAQLWVEELLDMNVTEEQDSARIETGLRKLRRTMRQWPQVADLIDAMPRRDTSTPAGTVTVQRQRTAAEEATAAEAMAEMRKMGIMK